MASKDNIYDFLDSIVKCKQPFVLIIENQPGHTHTITGSMHKDFVFKRFCPIMIDAINKIQQGANRDDLNFNQINYDKIEYKEN